MIAAKRQAFHSEVRKKQINRMISKIRCQVTKQNRVQILNAIIKQNNQTQKVDLNQLTVLIRWGLCGEDDAVAHLGNLIIDGILTFQLIQRYEQMHQGESIYGNSQLYLWLIYIFYQNNYFKQRQLLHLINLICLQTKKTKTTMNMSLLSSNTQFYQHGLLLLKKILKKHTSAVELIFLQQNKQRSRNLLKSLFWICQQGAQNKVVLACFSIVNVLACGSANQGNLIDWVGEKYFRQVVNIGLFRVQQKIRCLCYQILTNLMIQSQQKVQNTVLQLLPTILQKWQKQKHSVQYEITFLLLSCSERYAIPVLKYLILEENLVKFVRNMIEECSHRDVVENCVTVFKILRSKAELFNFRKYDYQAQYLFSQQLQTIIGKMEEQK